MIFKHLHFQTKRGEERAYKCYIYSCYLFSLIEVLCIHWYKPFQFQPVLIMERIKFFKKALLPIFIFILESLPLLNYSSKYSYIFFLCATILLISVRLCIRNIKTNCQQSMFIQKAQYCPVVNKSKTVWVEEITAQGYHFAQKSRSSCDTKKLPD